MRLLPLPGVFEPRSDSWMLARQLRSVSLPADASVLDLCAGSGLLAITAAQLGARWVFAVDISRRAVLATRLGALLNGVTVNAIRGDLYEPVGSERFDLIVSNPPYLLSPEGAVPRRGAARAWEGGADGRLLIDRICGQAHEHLRPGGTLLLLQSSVCGEAETVSALSAAGLEAGVVFRHHGRLGPLLRARAGWLARRGLLSEPDTEELLIVRARRPTEDQAARLRGQASSEPRGGAGPGRLTARQEVQMAMDP